MCLASQEAETRNILVGEIATIGPVRGHYRKITALVPRMAEPGIVCLCIPNGYVMRLEGLSKELVTSLGLVSNTAIVTFRQGTFGTKNAHDQFEFDNGSTTNFNRHLHGVRATCLATNHQSWLAEKAVDTDQPQPDEVHPGVLVRVASKAGSFVTAAAVLAGVLFLTH